MGMSDAELGLDVTMPNRTSSTSGMTDAQLGIVNTTPENYDNFVPQFLGDVPPSMSPPMEGPPLTYGQAIGDATLGNAATILGVGGSFVGSPMVGGAIGSAIGGAIEEAYEGTDDEFERATTEGLMSLGVDAAMKLLPAPVRLALIAAKKALGMNPIEAAQDIAKSLAGKAGAFGSNRAKLQAQAMANEAGTSLPPFNLSKKLVDSGHIGEKIGRMGFFSAGLYERNAQKIVEYTTDHLNKIFKSKGLDLSQIGTATTEVMKQARDVGITRYGEQLSELGSKLKGGMIFSDPLLKGLENFKKFGNKSKNPKNKERSFILESGYTSLDGTTQSILKELEKVAGESGTKMTGSFLLKFDAEVSKLISAARHDSANGLNNNADRELSLLSDYMKKVISSQLKKIDPSVARDYQKLRKSHAKFMGNVFPDINADMVRAGNQGKYQQIGAMFHKTDANKIAATLKSLKESYAVIPKDQLKNLSIPSEKEALEAIRESYINTTLKTYQGIDGNIYGKAAEEMNNVNQRNRVKSIMGENFETYRKAVNTVAEATKDPASGISLIMRGQEAGQVRATASGVAQGVSGLSVGGGVAATTGGVAAATTGAALGAGVVFGVPWVLAKASLSPKRVNRLIQLKNTDFSKMYPEKKIERVLQILNGFVDTEEEQDMLMEWANDALGMGADD
jgi:hypothetical protein